MKLRKYRSFTDMYYSIYHNSSQAACIYSLPKTNKNSSNNVNHSCCPNVYYISVLIIKI